MEAEVSVVSTQLLGMWDKQWVLSHKQAFHWLPIGIFLFQGYVTRKSVTCTLVEAYSEFSLSPSIPLHSHTHIYISIHISTFIYMHINTSAISCGTWIISLWTILTFKQKLPFPLFLSVSLNHTEIKNWHPTNTVIFLTYYHLTYLNFSKNIKKNMWKWKMCGQLIRNKPKEISKYTIAFKKIQ